MKCDQAGCNLDAIAAYVWPGREMLAACGVHLVAASSIAHALGFELDARKLDDLIGRRARDAVLRLDGAKHVDCDCSACLPPTY